MKPIRNNQQAANVLRSAIDLNRRGWKAEMRGLRAYYTAGNYRSHYERAEKLADNATSKFRAVQEYLDQTSDLGRNK